MSSFEDHLQETKKRNTYFFGDILKTTKKYWFHHLSSSYAFLETSRISHTYILFKNEEIFFCYTCKKSKTNKKVLSVLVPYKHWTKKSNDFVREKQLCRKRKKILSIVQNENFLAKSIM